MEPPQLEYVGAPRRLLIALADSAIVWCLSPLADRVMVFGFNRRTVLPDLAWDTLLLTGLVTLVIRCGGTPAKLMLGARIVDRHGRFLSVSAALLRDVPFIAGSLLHLVQLQLAFNALALDQQVSSAAEILQLMGTTAGAWFGIGITMAVLAFVDVGAVLLNRQRRALHDFLAGSYVVTRRSYRAARGLGPPVPVVVPPVSASVMLRLYAVVLALSSAWLVVYQGFFDVLPMAFSKQLRGEGLHGDLVPSVVIITCIWLMAVGSLAAAFGLWRRREWARAWIVCFSLASLVQLGVVIVFTQGAAGVWRSLNADLGSTFSILRLVSWATRTMLAVVGLYLLLIREGRWGEGRPRRLAWGTVFSVLLALYGMSLAADPRVRRAWQQRSASATTIEPGSGKLVVRPRFDGRPLDLPDATGVRVTLYEIRTKTQRDFAAGFVHGAIEVAHVPTGVYVAGIAIDANPDNGLPRGQATPGDYEGSDSDQMALVRDGQTATGDIKVYRLLRLLSPEDTGPELPADKRCPQLAAPRFSWEPVPRATGYRCFVTRHWQEDGQWRSTYARSSYGPDTNCVLDLPPSGPGEAYELEVTAEGQTGRLSSFQLRGRGWRGFRYCFTLG